MSATTHNDNPEAELIVGNPDWMGDDHEGGFAVAPLMISKKELALPDDKWLSMRDLYVSGITMTLRKQIEAWYDEQRATYQD